MPLKNNILSKCLKMSIKNVYWTWQWPFHVVILVSGLKTIRMKKMYIYSVLDRELISVENGEGCAISFKVVLLFCSDNISK